MQDVRAESRSPYSAHVLSVACQGTQCTQAEHTKAKGQQPLRRAGAAQGQAVTRKAPIPQMSVTTEPWEECQVILVQFGCAAKMENEASPESVPQLTG